MRQIVRGGLTGLLAILACLATVVVATPASAGLTERTCKNFDASNHTRRLSVCARAWVGTGQARGVVEMQSQELSGGTWVPSVSQSITLNAAQFFAGSDPAALPLRSTFGADYGQSTCRIDGPGGTIGCGKTNTARVAFYSPVWAGVGQYFATCVNKVSWRDDNGTAHVVTAGDASFPDRLPFCSDPRA